MELIRAAIPIALLTFVVSSMLAMGLGLTPRQVAGPLGNLRLVLASLFASFVVMPLGELALGSLLQLDQSLSLGLLLLGAAAGAPFLPKLAEIADADLAFAVGLMVLLMVTTVVFVPIVVPLVLPGVSIEPARIARSLVLLMLLPLSAALVFRARFALLAARIRPALARLSTVALLAFALLVGVSNVRNVLDIFGTRGLLAGALFIVLGIAAGWLLGGADSRTRRTLALGTGQRNIAAAVVAGREADDPRALVMIVVVAIIGFVILVPLARAFGNRSTNSTAPSG